MRLDPLASVVGLAGCFVDWILTRPWKLLVLFFFPLVFATVVGGLVAAGSWMNRDVLADNYLKLADKEVAKWESKWAPVDPVGDQEESGETERLDLTPTKDDIPPAAEMLFRRVQQLQKSDRRSMFFVAMSYVQRGALQQGMTMLSRIAPDDSIGYLPAHAYMTEYLLSRPIARKDLPVIRHHMLATLRWNRASPQLLATISQLLFNINDKQASVEAMTLAADRDPSFNLPLAKLCATDAQNQLQAEKSLESAVKHFSAKVERNPHDVNARLLLVDCYCQKLDFANAEKLLTDGMKLTDNPLLKTALSEVYCRTFISTSKLEDDKWTGDIELLERAFRLDPNNLHIYEEVAKLARIGGESPHEGLMNQLRKNLAEGKATSVTHTWIAEHYLIHNQFEKAIPHLEQAVKRDPQASRCWNNLAYCVADRFPDRLEDALKYADQALTIAPRVPDYHDTRGTILMKMKRFTDAVASYELAIESVTNSGGRYMAQPGYHSRLAAAYTAIGDESMSRTHQEMADKLVAQLEEAKLAAAAAAANPAPEATPPAPAPADSTSTPTATEPPASSVAGDTPTAASQAGEVPAQESATTDSPAKDSPASDPPATEPATEPEVPASPTPAPGGTPPANEEPAQAPVQP